MTISMDDINFRTELPDVPERAPVIETRAMTREEREPAIKLIIEGFGIDGTREIETEHSRIWASRDGEVEFFPGSGAVWGREADNRRGDEVDEFRNWPALEEGRSADGEPVLELDESMNELLAREARQLIEAANFSSDHVLGQRITLEQVDQADEHGRTLRRGAGEAAVLYDYAIEGLPVMGAGAKTKVAFVPETGQSSAVRLRAATHFWREPVDAREVAIGGIENALAAGFFNDPELVRAQARGDKITVEHLRFGLLALPAPLSQTYLFPVLAVEGRVDAVDDSETHWLFARYCHAANPAAYAKEGLLSHYLMRPN